MPRHDADHQARNIARGLVPVALEPDGLREALHGLVARTNLIPGITCALDEDGEIVVEDKTTATHLFRIAQEAVNNAVRHASASRITIRLLE